MRVANKGESLTNPDQQRSRIASNIVQVTVQPKIKLSEGFTLQKFNKEKGSMISAPTSLKSNVNEIRIPMHY